MSRWVQNTHRSLGTAGLDSQDDVLLSAEGEAKSAAHVDDVQPGGVTGCNGGTESGWVMLQRRAPRMRVLATDGSVKVAVRGHWVSARMGAKKEKGKGR